MRLFVAIELPDAWREEARRIGEHLVAALGDDARLRFTATERLHLTLRFLGDVDEAVLPDLRDQLAQEVASVRVPLELAGVGQFGSRSRPTVLWFGLAGDLDRLASLHDAVERAVVAAGLEGDDRPLRPHVTFARVARQATSRASDARSATRSPRPRRRRAFHSWRARSRWCDRTSGGTPGTRCWLGTPGGRLRPGLTILDADPYGAEEGYRTGVSSMIDIIGQS